MNKVKEFLSKVGSFLVNALKFFTGLGFYGFGLLGVGLVLIYLGVNFLGWAFIGAFVYKNYAAIVDGIELIFVEYEEDDTI